MEFKIDKAIEIFRNTPDVLKVLLNNISVEWIKQNEGENTWSPYEIVEHFIHGEKAHWISRVRTILAGNEDAVFKLFDSSDQFSHSKEKPIAMLLDEFAELRINNITELKSYNITEDILLLKATHPSMGKVNLKQLLAAWVVHDLNHIKQIARVMAKQYKTEMGPWEKYILIK